MFHLLANYGSLAATANLEVPAISDQVIQITNSRHRPGKDMDLVCAYGVGDLLLRARLASPKTRAIKEPYIYPLGVGAANDTPLWPCDLRNHPFRLRANEEIIWEITNSGAGPTATYIFSILQAGFTPAPRGEIYTIRGTGTTTMTANAWTEVTVTWEAQLPVGRYAVIGGNFIGASARAFQVIFEDQFYRPGGFGIEAEGTPGWEGQMKGGLGLWGEFETTVYPRIMGFCDSADTAETVYLEVIKIR